MDLLDFDEVTLYFDEAVDPEVEALIADAGRAYGEQAAESLLLKAEFMAPESLLVMVALYRYYFYRHCLQDALVVADRALAIVGRRLDFPADWSRLQPELLGEAGSHAMGLLRFYLHVLKAAAYINLRLERFQTGKAMLEKLVELDSHDRMGAKALLDVVVQAVASRIEEAA